MRVQTYLREKFGNPMFYVRARKTEDGAAEVYLDDEFIGVIFRDDEDDDLSYAFQMAILDIDLPEL